MSQSAAPAEAIASALKPGKQSSQSGKQAYRVMNEIELQSGEEFIAFG